MSKKVLNYFGVLLLFILLIGIQTNVYAFNSSFSISDKVTIEEKQEENNDEDGEDTCIEDDDNCDEDGEDTCTENDNNCDENEEDNCTDNDNCDQDDDYDEKSVIEDSKISDVFIDKIFSEKIRVALGKVSVDEIISQNDLDSINSLDLSCQKDSNNCIEEFRGTKFLRNLVNLDVSNVEDIDTYEVGSLSNLKYLNIDNCSALYLNDLEELLQLEKLIISNNSISNLDSLENLVNLKELDAQNNDFKSVNGLKKLVKLEKLNLSNTELRDISGLSELINLVDLNLNQTKINNLASLSKLNNLEYLSLNNTRIVSIDSLSDCTKLKSLKINRIFDGKTNGISNIEILKNFSNLTTLELENHSIGDMSVFKEGFVGLSTLKLNNQYHVESPLSLVENEFSIKNNYFKDNNNNSITPSSISSLGVYDQNSNTVNWKDFGSVDDLNFTIKTNSKINHEITGHIIIPLGTPVLNVDKTEITYYVDDNISEDEFFDDIGVDIKLIKASQTSAYGTITSNFTETVNFEEKGEYIVTISAKSANNDVLEDKNIIVTISDTYNMSLLASLPEAGYNSTIIIVVTLGTMILFAVRYKNR